MKNLPDGKLICCTQDHSRIKWYHSNGHTKTYIPKQQRRFAEQLAKKKYLTLTLEELSQEQRALDFYLRHHSQQINTTEKLLTDAPGFQELLKPYFTTQDQKISQWLTEPYAQNPKYPEKLIHKSASGKFVRSKSEALIDLYLFTQKIPFRYEAALTLGDTVLYPDFTILHPVTGELYYWEHFGLMDRQEYSKNAFSKLQLYTSYGIIPTINLITTYETEHHPLSSEIIEKIVEYYFL